MGNPSCWLKRTLFIVVVNVARSSGRFLPGPLGFDWLIGSVVITTGSGDWLDAYLLG